MSKSELRADVVNIDTAYIDGVVRIQFDAKAGWRVYPLAVWLGVGFAAGVVLFAALLLVIWTVLRLAGEALS